MSQPRFGLSLTQLAASAAAAASAAFGASYLGVAGTIAGAAIASVIATVATAMYESSLRRSRDAVRRAGQTWPRMPEPAILATPATASATALVPDPGTPDTRELPVIAPEPPRDETSRRPGWPRLALATLAVLGISLGSVTAFEGVLGKPLSALLGGPDANGTSLGSAVGGGSSSSTRDQAPAKKSTPAPSSTPSSTPADTPTSTPTSTGTPTSTPTETPTSTPTGAPTETPTAEPTPTVTPPR